MSGSLARLLLLKTGSTVPSLRRSRGDFERWFADGAGEPLEAFEVIDVEAGQPLPAVGRHAAVIVTGSPALVTDRAPWSEACARWLAAAVAVEQPLLAVCYGHQLLAHGLEGEVGDNPRGREIGTVEVELTPAAASDPLFAPFARRGAMTVQETHVQSVLELPSGAVALGASAGDPHQIFRVGRAAWGVQFHPEFDAAIIRGYLEARREPIAAEGLDPDAIAAAARDSDDGTALLARFVALARGEQLSDLG